MSIEAWVLYIAISIVLQCFVLSVVSSFLSLERVGTLAACVYGGAGFGTVTGAVAWLFYQLVQAVGS